jgi:hypothetical protein
MDRLSLTDVPFRKWVPYLLTFMNETDRIWAEQNNEMKQPCYQPLVKKSKPAS